MGGLPRNGGGMIPIRLGTRSSPLAMAQASLVGDLIRQANPDIEPVICPMTTLGDRVDGPLQAMGGKGVFIRDIEQALLDCQIDMAVHSLKDVTANMAYGTILGGFVGNESCRDCLVGPAGVSLATLPVGAKVGTGSLRRRALLAYHRPDVEVVPIRGNIQRRLDYLSELDAIVLSEVSLLRLPDLLVPYEPLSPLEFVPAPGQGVIGLQVRSEDSGLQELARGISPDLTWLHASAHMQFLRGAQFDCRIPLGIYSTVVGDEWVATVFKADESLRQMQWLQYACGFLEREEKAFEWGVACRSEWVSGG